MPLLRLLYMGRIVPSKGVHILLEALTKLCHEHQTPCHLDIVGPVESAYRDELFLMARSRRILDHVSIYDSLPYDDVPQCYRDHDMLIFPSTGIERFPLVILEGMACGLPIVATLTGGHREFLKDEQNCLICQPGDPNDLANKITLLVKNRNFRERIARAGMKTVKEEFSLDQILNQMEIFLYEASDKQAFS
jgi:glycosyltransferase involved in cell wall biosynthesis